MNRMQQVFTTAGAAFLIALSASAIAHHGWSGYESEIRKVSGVIEQSSYAWVVVLAPPSRMSNRGLTAEMLKVGSNVSVEGYPHMSDKNEMRAERITLDGKTVELR
jgi:hypothetical protein